MATVEIKGLVKTFGKTEVLHGIDLAVEDGEFVVFVGPSGCGKSTTLRLLAGLDEVTSGEILIGGNVVNNLEPKERNIAMVFQTMQFIHICRFVRTLVSGYELLKCQKQTK